MEVFDTMSIELVTFKLDDKFLREVDAVVKKSGFSNRTDFIRDALREKVSEIKLKEAMIEIGRLKGKSKKKTTDEMLERIREEVFREFEKKFK
jgi:metal-responsive CopG/Arc/MetJ family transcriptional regulator